MNTKDVRRGFVNHKKFLASWIFIATWDRVAFYGTEGESDNKVIGIDKFFAFSQA